MAPRPSDPSHPAATPASAALLAQLEAISRAIGEAFLPGHMTSGHHLLLHRRVRAVAAAEEFLSAAIGRAVYTQEVAAALGAKGGCRGGLCPFHPTQRCRWWVQPGG
jgi:hypothetical protein